MGRVRHRVPNWWHANHPDLLLTNNGADVAFAIVEECQPWGDCDAFTSAYGTRWYEVEYADAQDALEDLKDACATRGSQVSVILRDRDLVPPSDNHYLYQVCSDVQ
jgi:hypothetical protein